MNVDILKFQVKSIDGSSESIVKAVEAIERYLTENNGSLPRSVEHSFFEETTKSMLNWIGKGEQKTIEGMLSKINSFLVKHDELTYPLSDLNDRKRLGAKLNFLCETLNIYLRADIELKDQQRFLSSGKVQERLRELMAFLYEINEPFSKEKIEKLLIIEKPSIYTQREPAAKSKAIQRDLNELVKYDLLHRDSGDHRHIYMLSPRAYYFKEKIMALQPKRKDRPVVIAKTTHANTGRRHRFLTDPLLEVQKVARAMTQVSLGMSAAYNRVLDNGVWHQSSGQVTLPTTIQATNTPVKNTQLLQNTEDWAPLYLIGKNEERVRSENKNFHSPSLY